MNHDIYRILGVFGSLLLLLSLFGGVIKNRLYASEPAIALACGVLLGPQVLNLFPGVSTMDLAPWVEHLARITLAIALLDVATDLPTDYIWRKLPTLLVMVGLVMPLMCLVSGALAWGILGYPLLTALLIGAVVSPTDPVVCSAVTSGTLARRAIPERVRHLLMAESGANDALAFLLVMLPILLLGKEPAAAWFEWATRIVLWEVGLGILIGIIAGLAAGLALKAVVRWTTSETSSLITVSITLAMAVLGGVKLIHSDGLIAVFTAGLTLNRFVHDELKQSKDHVHEALRRLFELPAFIVLGIILPWSHWADLGWPGFAFALAVVLLRRLPAIFALQRTIRPLHNVRETLFVGWFGPIGIAALLYSILARKQTGLESIWDVTSLVIVLSVTIHGCTATPLTRLFHTYRSQPPRSVGSLG